MRNAMSPTSTTRSIPKWEYRWLTKGRAYDIPTVCRQLDSQPLTRVEPRMGDGECGGK